MNFEEAFARYQAHTATAEETALVERELEKFRLLEDYLAARELPDLPETLPYGTESLWKRYGTQYCQMNL